jgi:Cysteine-rich secretory protein family
MNVWVRPLSLSGLGFVLTIATALAGVQTRVATLPASSFSDQVLNAHNKYRAAVGVPPLVWSGDLAAAARVWANALNSSLQFAHDPDTQNQGENLWMGTAGAFSVTQMVDSWGQERRNFQNGTFPNVSTTGSWSDVGHYSQMVWRNTTSVGCAGASGSDGNYRLVCRYGPPGNVMGQRVF